MFWFCEFYYNFFYEYFVFRLFILCVRELLSAMNVSSKLDADVALWNSALHYRKKPVSEEGGKPT